MSAAVSFAVSSGGTTTEGAAGDPGLRRFEGGDPGGALVVVDEQGGGEDDDSSVSLASLYAARPSISIQGTNCRRGKKPGNDGERTKHFSART